MRRFPRLSVLTAVLVAIAVAIPVTVLAHGGGGSRRLSAEPWIFVGKANDPNVCGNPYPAGSRIVTSAWLGGMGLPDNGASNTLGPVTGTSPSAASRRDPHRGLLLSKNGPTGDCSSAGATIKGVKGLVVDADFALGYDYRNGGHCGAGAPRFNVDTDMGFFFVGCANAPQAPAPQDPEWTQTRSVLVTCGIECYIGAVPLGARINSIDIVFDEGTDTANLPGETPAGAAGLAVIDNIFVDGRYIRSGSGIEPGGGGRDDDDHDKRDDDD